MSAPVGNRDLMRAMNHSVVLNMIKTRGPISRTEVARLTGLSPATTFYVRSFAINAVGTAYGNQETITTLADIPSAWTAEVDRVTHNSARCGGSITADGGAAVTARGVCWSTKPDPTVADAHTTDGSGTGHFTSRLTGLAYGTVYYVRAYGTNSAGTGYGATKVFKTTNVYTVRFRAGDNGSLSGDAEQHAGR